MPVPASVRSSLLSILRGATLPPTETSLNSYLALLTATPAASAVSTSDASVQELSVSGYARLGPIAWGSPAVSSGALVSQYASSAVFGPFTAAGSTVTVVALVSTATGVAALRYWWPMQAGVTPTSGGSITLAANSLSLSLTA